MPTDPFETFAHLNVFQPLTNALCYAGREGAEQLLQYLTGKFAV